MRREHGWAGDHLMPQINQPITELEQFTTNAENLACDMNAKFVNAMLGIEGPAVQAFGLFDSARHQGRRALG